MTALQYVSILVAMPIALIAYTHARENLIQFGYRLALRHVRESCERGDNWSDAIQRLERP